MNILVFRALKVGDLLCSMPALYALRNHFPEANISILALSSMTPLLSRYDSVFDSIIPFAGYPGLPEKEFDDKEYQEMLSSIHPKKFDLLIQMHGDGSGLEGLLQDLSIPIVWGYSPVPQEGLVEYPHFLHEISRHLYLLAQYGVEVGCQQIPFPTTTDDEKLFEALKSSFHLDQTPYILMHLGASTESRMWGVKNFVEAARLLTKKEYRIVLSGVEKEQYLAHIFQELADFPVTNLMGKANLGVTALLLKMSKGLVTNCTGISHLASATQTKSIVISKDGEAYRWAPINKEIHTTFDCSEQDLLPEVLDRIESDF